MTLVKSAGDKKVNLDFNKEFINTIRNNNYSGRLNLYHTKSKKVDLTERYMRKSKNYFKPR